MSAILIFKEETNERNFLLAYLKEYKKALYTSLLMKEELTNHLISVSENVEDLLNNLMESY